MADETREQAVERVVREFAVAEAAAEEAMVALCNLQRSVIKARAACGLHPNVTAPAIAEIAATVGWQGEVAGGLAKAHVFLREVAEKHGLPLPPVTQGGGGGGK